MANKLAEQVVAIMANYLGPEARRFLERQVKHLASDVNMDNLNDEHMEKLCWWIFVSGKLIMKNEKAQEMADKVRGLIVVKG